MEGFGKWLSPSKSTASPKPSYTGENDENDSSQDKMIPKLQNQKKSASKHFMSPTISAASKAAPPRNKILSERNENLSNSDLHNHKTSILDKKMSPRNSIISHSSRSSPRIISSFDRAASETDDDWDTDFIDNSSAKFYDPVKNYLSPRPKYLRFNPNRCREIFNRLENEELNGSFDSQEGESEEIQDPKENEENIENKENDEEDEELEEEIEEEEERGWCCRELIKLVLILIACVLSTSYICTMNSQSPTTTQQAFWKVKDGCLVIKRRTLEMIGMKIHEDGFLKMEAGDDYGEFVEDGFEADYMEIIEDDAENLEMVEIYEDKNRETEKSVVKVEVNENDVENLERVDNGENEDSVDVEIIEDGVDEVEIDEDKNREIEEIVKVEIVENDVENLEKVDYDLVENEGEISEDKMDNVSETEGARFGQYEVKPEILDRLVDATEKIKPVTEKTDEKGSHEKSTDSGREVENEKVGRKNSVVIGFSVISIILAILAIIVDRLKKKPRNALAEKSEPVLKPHKLAAVEEKKRIEFIAAKPSSLAHSIQESPEKLVQHHICAPTVELIGEIDVGIVSSRRIRKYEDERDEGSADYLPKSSRHECSNISSSSYGSFTTETKILKKEGGGQSGEGTAGVTPVRRSRRLRSRAAVTSP